MMYPIVMRYESKHGIRAHLERCNIETRDRVPLVSQPAYRGLWNPDDYPVARNIDERGFYIGCHQDLTVQDIDDIAEAFNHYARGD
jgi:dTDP-4-amino-4,6-dideoxygalactose transaminase